MGKWREKNAWCEQYGAVAHVWVGKWAAMASVTPERRRHRQRQISDRKLYYGDIVGDGLWTKKEDKGDFFAMASIKSTRWLFQHPNKDTASRISDYWLPDEDSEEYFLPTEFDAAYEEVRHRYPGLFEGFNGTIDPGTKSGDEVPANAVVSKVTVVKSRRTGSTTYIITFPYDEKEYGDIYSKAEVAAGISPPASVFGCSVCDRRAKFHCGGCSSISFCSSRCQTDSWDGGHHSVCDA